MRCEVNFTDKKCVTDEIVYVKNTNDYKLNLLDAENEEIVKGSIVITIGRVVCLNWQKAYPEVEGTDADAKMLEEVYKNALASILPFISFPIELTSLTDRVLRIVIDTISNAQEGSESDECIYRINGMQSAEELVKSVTYGGEVTPYKIKRELLRRAQFEYDYATPSNMNGALFTPDLINNRHMFVSPTIITRQANVLIDNGYLEPLNSKISSRYT